MKRQSPTITLQRKSKGVNQWEQAAVRSSKWDLLKGNHQCMSSLEAVSARVSPRVSAAEYLHEQQGWHQKLLVEAEEQVRIDAANTDRKRIWFFSVIFLLLEHRSHRCADREGWSVAKKLQLNQKLKEAYKKIGEQFFTWVNNDSTRGNGFKLQEGRFS